MPDRCRCTDISLLWDAEADEYTDHLVRQGKAPDGTITYRCPFTGRQWVAEFITEGKAATALRMTRVMHAGELVAFLAEQGDSVDSLDFTHPDVEFRPPGSDVTYRGTAEARRWREIAATDPDFPQTTPVSMIEASEEEVVVLGTTAFRRGGDYHEQKPTGWLVTVRDGKLIRSIWFDSWSKARAAGGLPEEGGPEGRKIGNWAFALGRRVLASLRGLLRPVAGRPA
jgi:ketosteroid isomerase-like protein